MSTLTRWNPMREMVTWRDVMDRLWEDRFLRTFGGWPSLENGLQTLPVDVAERDSTLVVEASLPGYDPDEVEISISGNVLAIKGEHKQEAEKEEGQYHLHERFYGAFQRTVNLPTEVNAEAAEATFDKGVLHLTLPKIEAAHAKRIEVKAK